MGGNPAPEPPQARAVGAPQAQPTQPVPEWERPAVTEFPGDQVKPVGGEEQPLPTDQDRTKHPVWEELLRVVQCGMLILSATSIGIAQWAPESFKMQWPPNFFVSFTLVLLGI